MQKIARIVAFMLALAAPLTLAACGDDAGGDVEVEDDDAEVD